MQSYKNLIHKVPLKNVIFKDKDTSANLIILSENIDDFNLKNYLQTQIKANIGTITIPGIVNNFLNKKISSQKYYIKIKKEIPNYKFSRVPTNNNKLVDIFDISVFSEYINKLVKLRSEKIVFEYLSTFLNKIALDYKGETYLLILGSEKSENYLLQLIKYVAVTLNNKLVTKLSGIIYLYDDIYYPVALTKEDKDDKKLYFLKNIIDRVLNIDKKNKTEGNLISKVESLDDLDNDIKNKFNNTKKTIEELLNDTNLFPENKQKNISKIKDLVMNLPELKSDNFKEKLEELYNIKKEENIKRLSTPVDKIDKHLKDLNKQYNGVINVEPDKNLSYFDSTNIVGLENLSNYNKQKNELNENMDQIIQDLLEDTLLRDPELNITIKNIKTKIVDDHSNRYKEYIITIEHKDVGKTTNKPYNIRLQVPIVIQDKYIKIGGNNYIMVNQLFNKPITKVKYNLVRFYTHYSTCSLELKNSKLNAVTDFKELEENFIIELKKLKKIEELKEFDNKLREELFQNYEIPHLENMKYKKIIINI